MSLSDLGLTGKQEALFLEKISGYSGEGLRFLDPMSRLSS
jgi:hypothetical protein